MENTIVGKNVQAKAVIPSIRYKDAQTAIDWLCRAFGFKKHLVVPGENRTIRHAQLCLGDVMVMTASQQSDTPYGKLTRLPGDLGNFITQSAYIVLDEKDIEDHYKAAKENGARMLIDLKEEGYGGKGYTCRDIEGHVWSFGSYDPFDPKS